MPWAADEAVFSAANTLEPKVRRLQLDVEGLDQFLCLMFPKVVQAGQSVSTTEHPRSSAALTR